MAKFKIGDAVRFAPGVTNDTVVVVPRLLDMDRVYHVSAIKGDSSYVLRETIPGLLFHESWLIKNTEPKMYVRFDIPTIDKVIFSGPATIVFWTDGTKTVVKCRKGDKFDPEKGIAMACAKKLLGNEDGYHKEIAKYTNVENSVKAEPPKDIEKLRRIVSASCFPLNCVTECPCRKLGYCFTISRADRKELLLMYGAFQKAGKLKGVE